MNYIIAKTWNKDKPVELSNLGIYTYFETIHTDSTIEQAHEMRDDIQARNPENKYDIYEIILGDKLK